MKYKHNDLKICDLWYNAPENARILFQEKYIISFLSRHNPNRKYKKESYISKKDWDLLVSKLYEYTEDFYKAYEKFIDKRKKKEYIKRKEELKLEFNTYCINHKSLSQYVKPIKIKKRITVKDLNTIFKVEYSKNSKGGTISVEYCTEIEGKKYYFGIEDDTGGVYYIYGSYRYYKDNIKKFENKISKINKFLFRNLFRYKIYDIIDFLEDIYSNVVDEELLSIDYIRLNEFLDNSDSYQKIKSYEILYLSNILNYGYDYFEYLDELKNRKEYTYLSIYRNYRNIVTNKYNYAIVPIKNKLTLKIINSIKKEDNFTDLLFTYDKYRKETKEYQFLGLITNDFDFHKLDDKRLTKNKIFNEIIYFNQSDKCECFLYRRIK